MERDLTAYPMPSGGRVPPDAVPDRKFTGSMRWDVICELAQLHHWTKGAEIGTADGRTTLKVLTRCPELTMLTVDLWDSQPALNGPETYHDWDHAAHERKARADLAPFGSRAQIMKAESKYAARFVESASLDFVFLDGDHSEYGVRSDIYAWKPKLRPGGALLVHDINWTGVQQAMRALCPGYWIGPNNVAGLFVE